MDYGLYFDQKLRFKVKNIVMQLFALQDIDWCTEVVWITWVLLWRFLSAIWILILTAPIH